MVRVQRRNTVASVAGVVGVVGLVGVACGCLPQYRYEVSAPPVAKTVTLLESDPSVAAALGDDAEVSLAVARIFDRDITYKWRSGRDVVRLMTTVHGSRGEATLDLDATNVREQGWAGRFSLSAEGQQVLRDGQYVTEGGGTLLEGTFAPDGTPVVAARPQ